MNEIAQRVVRTFVVQFNEDRTKMSMIDSKGRRLLSVAVKGHCDLGRAERIAKLASDLLAECRKAQIVVSPVRMGGDPS